MYSLTQAQAKLLGYLKEKIAVDQVAPSYEEMMLHMRFESKSGIHRLLAALEERGHIQRLKYRARAIKILEPK